MSVSEKNVVVTGFGPFEGHDINASWEAVKLLPDHIKDVNIIKYEIPVVYTAVDEKIPELWEEYKPILVIHVGVSYCANSITIETVANRTGYIRQDCQGNCHCTGVICEDGKDTLCTKICVDDICNHLNEKCGVKACISNNAGRFLCEYIFYKSLHIDQSKVLFIHVPVLNNPYSAEELKDGLVNVIEKALELL